MGYAIFLVVTTLIGGEVGNIFFDAALLGAVIGFIVGVIIISGASGGLVDIMDGLDD